MIRSIAALLFVGLVTVCAQSPSSTPRPSNFGYYNPYNAYSQYPYQQYQQYAYQPYAYQQYAYQPYAYQQYSNQQYAYQPYGYQPYAYQQYPYQQYSQYKYPQVGPTPVAFQKPAVVPQPGPVGPSPGPVAPIKSGVPDKVANIVAESNDVGPDGSFSYAFDTDNGISVKSKGFVKPPSSQNEEPAQVIEGSYAYYDNEGKPSSVSYVADEQGYRAVGDAIPQLSEEHARAIANSIAQSA